MVLLPMPWLFASYPSALAATARDGSSLAPPRSSTSRASSADSRRAKICSRERRSSRQDQISARRPLTGGHRHQLFPPLWGEENSQQPVKRLCIAPRARTSWYVTCLEPPWALLPLEPRVRPLVGHFGLASIGTERTPHRPAYIIGQANSCSTRLQQELDRIDS